MAEIKLNKTYKCTGDIAKELIEHSDWMIEDVMEFVNSIKNADVVEVVRCKDCKHFTAGYCCRDIKGRSQMHYMGEEAFCSYGERRTDNDL